MPSSTLTFFALRYGYCCDQRLMPSVPGQQWHPALALLVIQQQYGVWLVLLWLFVLGAVVGSFLNVVIYRLPRGMSIVRPGSQCPACRHPIRWHDNVPIVSWFLLRGHCRDCGARFSLRYAVVEAVVALLFAILGWLEWIGRSASPLLAVVSTEGSELVVYSSLDLAGLYVFHLVLVCGLLCLALIDWDGFEVPWSLAAPVLGIGVILPVVHPLLRPLVDFAAPRMPQVAAGPVEAVTSTLVALLAAATVAVLSIGIMRRLRQPLRVRGAAAYLVAVAVYLGWTAVVAIGLSAMLIGLLLRYAANQFRASQVAGDSRAAVPLPLGALLGAVVWIAAWSWVWRAWPP